MKILDMPTRIVLRGVVTGSPATPAVAADAVRDRTGTVTAWPHSVDVVGELCPQTAPRALRLPLSPTQGTRLSAVAVSNLGVVGGDVPATSVRAERALPVFVLDPTGSRPTRTG